MRLAVNEVGQGGNSGCREEADGCDESGLSGEETA